MSPAAWLIAFIFPACGQPGSAGVPPPPVDLMRMERPGTPNTALAAPVGFTPAPDIVTRAYPVPPGDLLSAVARVAQRQPRLYVLAKTDARIDWVARSAVFNFPDEISAQTSAGADGATLVLYSRSIYGHSDLGVNRKRIKAWLAALDAELTP